MLQKRLKITGWLFVALLLKTLTVPGEPATSPEFRASDSSSVDDTLKTYITEANTLWNKKESDLDLSFQLLSKVTEDESTHYYDLATNFYFWSINNASFEQEKSAIEKEVERLIPLVSDSTKKEWKHYLDEEDPQLFREIIGFWRTADPFSGTKLNERLIEHWQRINYAQSNFTKSTGSPYGTDERGIYYVRLGAPHKYTTVDINLSHVYDPLTGRKISFELGTVIQKEVELWEYKGQEHEDDYFFLFGRDYGGEYGLLQNVTNLVDKYTTRVAFGNSSWMPRSTIRKISENALRLGLYEQLAPYHSHFQDMYNQIQSTLRGLNSNEPMISRFQESTGSLEMRTYHELSQSKFSAPNTKTSQKSEEEDLSVITETHRFLNKNNQNEYLFSIKPSSGAVADSLESLFVSQKLQVFDSQWNTISKIDDLKPLKANKDSVFTYQIDQEAVENEIYFSSELIDTTRNDLFIPGRINPKTSAIVKSTGKQRVSFANPLDPSESLLVSDILVGREQKADQEARVPISPSLDMRFDQDEDVMIYFETYNIPQEGYSFTYHFEKERWLLGNKKVEDKSEVTILADDAKDRDDQLFSINLDDLDSGSYQLVFEFSPINQTSAIEKRQKTISFEIVD